MKWEKITNIEGVSKFMTASRDQGHALYDPFVLNFTYPFLHTVQFTLYVCIGCIKGFYVQFGRVFGT